MTTTYQHRESGLIVPVQAKPKPPEHPARRVIREALAKISDDLGQFEHTTHGVMGPCSIESVAERLVKCYANPNSFEISDLAQRIDRLLEAAP